MSKILITGGAGFIGSNLAKALVKEEDNKVVVVDDLSMGQIENLEGLDLRFIEHDVTDKELIRQKAKEAIDIFVDSLDK